MIARYDTPTTDSRVDLDLSRNEGSTWFLDSIAGIENLAGLSNRYPQTDELQIAIAERHGIEPRQVLVTAGGDDALFRCFLARSASSYVATTPTFEMIGRYGEQTRSVPTEIPWWDGAFPVAEFVNAASQCDFSVVVSPNNPTGQSINPAHLRRVAESSHLLILDSAYAEFADSDLTSLALDLGNVLVIRTLSKAFGLAGLRVGYLIGPEHLVEEVSAFGNPYPVSGPSARLAELAIRSDPGDQRAFVDEVKAERGQLQTLIRHLGFRSLPSQGNFVTITSINPEWVAGAARAMGIAVRSFPGRENLETTVRVSLPGHADRFHSLTRALTAALAPQCLLFDLDGVIVDTSRSYDDAVIATAASFGVAVSRGDICATRAEGNANDDWELTARLCRRAGVDADIDDVTSRFEHLYQGTDQHPGLKFRETPLVDAFTLSNWRARMPLGIVTGRPRKDAEDVLDRFGLTGLFDTVVTREDAPLKPDPAPVRLALNSLGVDNGWMLGDTVDDITAARRAGVIPIAVHPHNDMPGESLFADAAYILESTAQLQEILNDTQF